MVLQTATLLAMDSIELIWRSLNNTVNRRTKFKDVYRRGEMFNGDIAGIPCHLYDKPWNKGNMLATSLKKVCRMGHMLLDFKLVIPFLYFYFYMFN